VAILSTGDELAEIEEPLGPGRITNSNTYTLMAQVRAAGGLSVSLGIARDAPESILERFRWGATADLLISSAGVSVGDHDHVKESLERLGAELRFWKVAMRPGKPLTFGLLQGRPVFGLPGNPVSSMVTFELFVRPALLKMMGHQDLFRPRVSAVAALPISNPGERQGYLRVSLAREGGRYHARLTGGQGSSILRSMLQADGLAVVAPDTTIPAGGEVEVLLLSESAAA
jgi:molybdopterin molybdotransferase